nr:RNA-directed DNA polymerase, eukaryota, reverse transcriptase zinc-binding domain protein [Tanacetum cinerariifolium]
FHGIINKRRNNLAIRGIMVDWDWMEDPDAVKKEFFSHFQNRFEAPCATRLFMDMEFPNRLSFDQALDLERHLSKEEIKGVVWDYGLDKLPGPNVKKKETMIFKVDFEKAFDFVRWDFLEDVLKNFGFGSRWCDWIVSCLKSSKGSVLVNGSPTSEFQFYKCLKQGDPLLPFLFILVMETLHLSFQNVVNAGLFKGVVLNNSLQLSHLFYADDAIFIVENSLVISAANNIGCMTRSPPFSYLGVHVGGHMSRIASWDVVINKVLSRLSKWKMKVLSVGGRLTLLKSVLGSTPIYYMSIFKDPVQVINKLKAIRSHFFHGVDPSIRKMLLVKWNNVLASKEMGGLGVSSFYAFNRALIFKWVWRFRTQGNSIWTKVIKALHGEEGNLDWPTTAKFPSKTGWILFVPFPIFTTKNLFPRLYALESVKNVSVVDKMAQPSLEYSFRHNIRAGAEQVQMASLLSLLEGLILPNMIDRWMWSISGDGEFSVSSVRNYIDDKFWERGLELQTILCPSCNLAVESTDHLFFSCSMMKDLYASIAKWWDVNMPEFSSFEECSGVGGLWWWLWLAEGGSGGGHQLKNHVGEECNLIVTW